MSRRATPRFREDRRRFVQGGLALAGFGLLAELLARPGAPDLQAIAELRQRHDTEQVSPIKL